MLDLIHPATELIERDMKAGLLVMLKGRLGRGDEVLSRLFFLHVFKNCLFHQIVRRALSGSCQGRDANPVGSIKLDGDRSDRVRMLCRRCLHGGTKDQKVTPIMAATLSLSRINWDLTTISAQVAARSGISAQRPGIHAMEDNCGKGYP